MNEIGREARDELPTLQILLWPKVTDENGERNADLSDIYAAFEELIAQLAALRDERDRAVRVALAIAKGLHEDQLNHILHGAYPNRNDFLDAFDNERLDEVLALLRSRDWSLQSQPNTEGGEDGK